MHLNRIILSASGAILLSLLLTQAICHAEITEETIRLSAIDLILPVFEALSQAEPQKSAPALDQAGGILSVAWYDIQLASEYAEQIDASTMASLPEQSPRLDLLVQAFRRSPDLPYNRAGRLGYLNELIAEYRGLREKANLGDNLSLSSGTETRKLIRAFACPDSSEAKLLNWPLILGALKEVQSVRKKTKINGADEPVKQIEQHAIQMGSVPMRVLQQIMLKDLASGMATGALHRSNFAAEREKFMQHLEQIGYNYKC